MSTSSQSSSDPEYFTYAVIGGGIAGVTCAEHLEILDGEHRVVLICGSDLIKSVTNVLHITKSIDLFDVEDRAAEHLAQQCPSVTVKPAAVKEIKHKEKLLHLTTGEVLQYSKLCVCTGALPKVIYPGHPHVLYIRDTESVKTFQHRIGTARRIVIVGNGGIATEMVYEITGVEVVWAVKDSWFTATFIDPGAAEFFRPQLCQDKTNQDSSTKRNKYTVRDLKVDGATSVGGALGPDWLGSVELSSTATAAHHLLKRRVQLLTDVHVTALHDQLPPGGDQQAAEGGPWPVYVELSSGRVIGCDFVVSATGVTPNTALLAASGEGVFKLGADGGVCVGEDMQTSVPGVYAAGDCITPHWEAGEHWQQMRLWTQARQMGSYAAKCMWAAHTDQRIYQDFCFELFTHATKFFGHKVVMLGLYNGQRLGGEYEVLLRMTRGVEYIKVVLKDDKMQGALLIGDTDLEETFENLILNQMDLSAYGVDLLDPDIDIEDYFD